MQETSGLIPKNLEFADKAREKLIKGIGKIADAVGSTLGPSGQTVLIESPHHTHGITVTKDGVTVAKAIDLLDPVENLAVRMVKEAAERTATSAGDGTTTSIVLTRAFVEAGMEVLSSHPNKTELLRKLQGEVDKVTASLKKHSRAVTKGRLKDVAKISANNDDHIGSIIAKVYKELGKDGIVTVDKSQTSETYSTTTNGLQVERGMATPLFINDQRKDECVLEDTFVLVSDAEISNVLQIENVLKPIITENKKLLIIAPCSVNVINTLAANKMKRDLKICVVQPPSFGYKQHELMQDIALAVGATYFSEKTGDDLSLMTPQDLGHADKAVVDRDSTIIVRDKVANKEEVDARVAELREAHKIAKNKADKDFILSRIAKLTGGIGVIYAGGNTDLEQKELYDRIDDAVCAVRSALEEGILAGGGIALYKESIAYEEDTTEEGRIMYRALRAPMLQILKNADVEFDTVHHEKLKYSDYNYGYNVKLGEFANMFDMGVIDPLKVTRTALQNAVSVATTILSTNAIITMARSYEEGMS